MSALAGVVALAAVGVVVAAIFHSVRIQWWKKKFYKTLNKTGHF